MSNQNRIRRGVPTSVPISVARVRECAPRLGDSEPIAAPFLAVAL